MGGGYYSLLKTLLLLVQDLLTFMSRVCTNRTVMSVVMVLLQSWSPSRACFGFLVSSLCLIFLHMFTPSGVSEMKKLWPTGNSLNLSDFYMKKVRSR